LLKFSKIALSLRVAVAMPTEALAQASHKFLHTATFANKTKVEWGRKVVENGFLGFQTTKNGSLLERKMEQGAVENSIGQRRYGGRD